MKIVCDQNVPLATELFGCHGDLQLVDGRSLCSAQVADADALIVRSVTPVNESLLGESKVKFVGSCTIGTDHLDIEYLDSAAIHWRHAPGCNAQSVVEYVASALAALGFLKPELTAAVIGCGRVGSAVCAELRRIGMDVRVYDPFLAADDCPGLTTLEDAMSSDVVCLHTPLTTVGPYPTHKMIGEAELNLLKQNALVLSAGRGGVIQEAALKVVASQRPDIRWVFDVWENEPQINKETLEVATIATPHIAGYSMEGRQNGSRQIYTAFCEFFDLDDGARHVDNEKLTCSAIALQNSLSSIDEMLLGVYDPREDDKRMRHALNSATVSERESGQWFDQQRRDYPERRERSAYSFKKALLVESLSSEDMELARSLGFIFS